MNVPVARADLRRKFEMERRGLGIGLNFEWRNHAGEMDVIVPIKNQSGPKAIRVDSRRAMLPEKLRDRAKT